MNDMTSKQKFGRLYYYATLIISIIIIVLSLFIFQSDGSEQMNNDMSVIRYMVVFYTFNIVLGSGIIVNEFCGGKFDKRKLIYKIIVEASLTVVGTIIFLLVFKAGVANMLFLGSLVGLLYVLTPTIK